MKNLFLLFAIIFLLGSCSNDGEIEVVQSNLNENFSEQNYLQFQFNKPIVSDTLVNQWQENEILEINPGVAGRIRWRSTTEMEFHPQNTFAPATTYQVELTKRILKHYDYEGFEGETKFTFSTPSLTVNSISGFWSETQDGLKLLTELEFNYPVSADVLNDFVSWQIDGETVSWKATEIEGSTVKGEISRVAAGDKDLKLEATLKAGAVPEFGNNKTEEAQLNHFIILSPYKLEVVDVDSRHDGVSGTVEITFSQNPESVNIMDYIDINPAVSTEVSSDSRKVVLTSEGFDVSQTYTITVKKDLKGKLGGKLNYDFNRQVVFGELRPDIRFTDRKAVYLGSAGNKNIEVRIVNTPEVEVKVYKVYPNNIQHYLDRGYFQDYWDDTYYDEYYTGDNMQVNQMGDLVYSTKIKSNSLPAYGSSRLFNFDFEDKLPNYEGLMVLEIRSTDNYWNWASKIVAFSDIGLIAKKGEGKISVFANSIKTAQPLAGVELSVMALNNQELGKVKTDEAGVAEIQLADKRAANFEPGMILARHGQDFTFLVLNRTQIETSRFEVGGYRKSKGLYQTYTYGERNIYRPGETLHLVSIIRDGKMQAPANLPFTAKLLSPDGKEFSTLRKTTNTQGSFEMDFPTQETSMTGIYNLQLYGPTDIFLGSYSVAVEEFVPHRIKTLVSLTPEEPMVGEQVDLELRATNLFGPPAADRKYEVTFSMEKSDFQPRNFPDYTFALADTKTDFIEVVREGKTDAEGFTSESYKIPRTYKNLGMLNLRVLTTVFDETGRPVNQVVTTGVASQDVFFGIKNSGYYYSTGSPVNFSFVALDKEAGEVQADAIVKLVKIQYRTVLSRSGDYFRYNSEREEVVISEKELKLKGTASLSFTPETSGSYEVRIFDKNSSTFVSSGFYAYGFGATNNSSFHVNNEGKVNITTDREKYAPGDKAKLLFNAPFNGRMLVTLERENVIEHHYLNTQNKAAELTIDIREEFLPNIYVSATLFRPHQNTDLPLTVAHGFQPVMVEKIANKLNVAIEGVGKTRSSRNHNIRVTTEPGAWVSIAAVDEGILQVSGFETPDPYSDFYQKQALLVSSSDVYPYLFPEVQSRQFLSGGGAGLAKRLNPLGNRRFELLSYWSGLRQADSGGKVEFEVSIPHFSGQLRVMAVAHKNERFGSSEKSMVIADPLVVSTAFPRFLSPGDKIEVPVTLSNTTRSEMSAKLNVSSNGPISATALLKQTDLRANSESQLAVEVVAEQQIGNGKVAVSVSGGGETYTQNINFSVRPASPLQKRNGYQQVKGGSTSKVSINTEGFIDQSIEYEILITKNPLGNMAGKLQELLEYPHGCIEQTVSKAFPQLYFSDLTEALSSEVSKNQSRSNVQAAIQKLKLMQLYDGGFTYWPGTGTATWWGTVYATHFLYEAREAGYSVDQSILDRAENYMLMRLQNREIVNYHYYDNKKFAPREVAYSMFVLASMGKPAVSMMNYYRSNSELLTDDGKMLLAAAYALNGDKKNLSALLPVNPNFEAPQENSGNFSSTIRNEAISLYALLKADQDNMRIPEMVRHLSQEFKNARHTNTQETVFTTLALGTYAKSKNPGIASAQVLSDGSKKADYSGNSLVLNKADLEGKNISIKNTGEADLYVFWQSEGISTDGSFKEEDSYISVRRRYYDRRGNLITDNVFEQNDLIVVKISLSSLTGKTIENIAVSDLLPAGLEIENARLTDVPDLNWIKDRSTPEYQDIRDDRMNIYDQATSKTRHYYYMTRAVTKGEFVLGPIAADAMYDGSIHSYSGGGKVRIR